MARIARRFLQLLLLVVTAHHTTALCEDNALGIESKTIPDGQLTSSSSFNVNTPAKNARLNFLGLPWCTVESSTPLYLQVDLGSLHAVCAVATQGNSKADQWVETYQLKISTDGTTWTDYEEGGQIRGFQGNADTNTTVKQVLFEGVVTKYVRVVPKTCHGLCCLRMELYGAADASCQTSTVGITDRSKIPDYRMTATSFYNKRYGPYNGRFSVEECAWEAKKKFTRKDYLQVDLGGVHFICALATKGNGKKCSAQEWTKKYKIYLSLDNKSWNIYKENGVDKEFIGNKDKINVQKNQVPRLPRAKFIRFWPTEIHNWALLRVEVYGTAQACRSSLGMELKSIKDSQITAQPNTNTPSNGRLYNTPAWCSSDTKAGYLQVDLGQVKTLTGVATQGHNSNAKWVKTYHISYKYDSSPWIDYKLKQDSGSIKTFDGNVKKNSTRVNWFPVPFVARHIRVIADSWTPSGSGPCLRMDLYGCDHIRRPRVSLESQFPVPTRGNFTCKVTSQPHTVIQWKNEDKDLTLLSTSVPQSNEFVAEDSMSSLRVDLEEYHAFRYDCERKSPSSNTAKCKVFISCIAFLAGSQARTEALQTSVLSITLPYPQISVSGNDYVIRLSEGDLNIAIECFGYGKPAPTVRWKKNGVVVSLVPSNEGVFQEIYNTTNAFPLNVTSRLYLGVSGVKLAARGIYACEVFNVVDVLQKDRMVTIASSCETKTLGIQKKTIPDRQLTSSSAFNASTPAKNARLNFVGLPWCAVESSTPLYLQVDLGSLHAVCAVATQGNSKVDQWVETYQLKTSTDGTTWTDYEEGGQVRDFQGNADSNTVVKQVLFEGVVSRYVRFVPKTCHEFCCLRVELYGAPDTSCRTTPVGIADRSKIPNHRMTATSSYDNRYAAYQGRFSVTRCAWESKKAFTGNDYLQVDLGGVHFICALATKGNNCANEWTKKYKIYLSLDNKSWNIYKENGVDKIFTGNTDKTTINTNDVSSLPRTKFIRFWPTDVKNWAVLRVEIYGAVQACRSSLGMEDNSITDSQITAQPNTNTPSNGRLYKTSTWCSSDTKAGYLQVDLGQVKTVTGVATQGHNSNAKWVKTYHISYKYDSSQWMDYKLKQDSGSIKTFNGNEDKSSVRVNWFPVPFVARYIRVIADSWTPSGSGPCLRIDLYGCLLVRRPRMSLESHFPVPTRGNFTCSVTSQPHTVIKWLNKNKDLTSQSTSVSQSVSESVNGVSISSLRVDLEYEEFDYDCESKVPSSSTVRCNVRFSCVAFLEGNQPETQSQQTSVVSVSLPFPQIDVPGPRMLRLREGQKNITIECFGYGKPVPTVIWKKGDTTVSFVRSNAGVFQKVDNTTGASPWNVTSRLYLGVSGATLTAGGNYTCEVSNALGPEYKVEKAVEVTFPPRFVQEPLSDTAIEGTNVSFVCNVSGFPRPTVVWNFNGARLPDVTKSVTAGRLILFAVRATDKYEGNYTCTASNRAGTVKRTVTLTVNVPARGSASGLHTLRLVKNATNITLDCYGYGKPTPVIQWKKDGKVVQVVRKFESSSAQSVVQVKSRIQGLPWNVTSRLYMRIGGVTFAEAGNYTCEVYNDVPQNVSVTETIEVLFPPNFIEEPSKQTVLKGSNVTFRCSASGMPIPRATWSFSGGSLPPHETHEGRIIIASVQNTAAYEGNYTCQAFNRGGRISRTVQLVVDVAPDILSTLKDVFILVGQRLVLTCNTSADPAAQIIWTKDNSPLPPRVRLENNNSTLILKSAVFDDDGRYTCVATNRQGSASSSATVEVQASAEIRLNPSETLKLLKHVKNVTMDCMAYGKPTPSIKWMKGEDEVEFVSEPNITEVVQIVINSTAESPWNVTSRLYLRVAGATYEDAGNYTCQVHNGVGYNSSLNATIEVLFQPEFDSSPKSKILLERSNITFPCNATGVPNPTMSWKFANGSLPQRHRSNKDGLTLFLIENDPSYEGNYTCIASNKAGIVKKTVGLTIDSYPHILLPLQDVFIHVGQRLQLTCNVSADPAAQILWTKGNSQLLPSHVKLENNNFTLTIKSVGFNDDGEYTCLATNRQGNVSSSATVEVQASGEVELNPSQTLKLRKHARNITVDCVAYGKPRPSVKWMKGPDEVALVHNLNTTEVVQIVFKSAAESPWNVTSRLYLRVAGATYEDAGNYTCQVHNGVGHNSSLNATIEVLFQPEFHSTPKSKTVLRGSNATFICNATGVPNPTITWTFGNLSLPQLHSTSKDYLTLFSVKNDPSYEGNYTCSASSRAGAIDRAAELTIDSYPNIWPLLQDVFIHAGEKLQLTCNVSADPAVQIVWTKDNSQLPPHAILENSNYTMIIESVVFDDDGRYTCVATNRQGNASSSATVEVQASAIVKLDPSNTLKLLKHVKNITVDCMAYGKPRPSIKWVKGQDEVALVNELNVTEVVQVLINSTESPWNVTSRLYLRVAGATYEDAGNYTCQVHNGVGYNSSLNATIGVLFRPEFDLYPESKIVVEGSNTTFLCNATGVPDPTISWKFGNGSLPQQHVTSKDGLTLLFIENGATFEGNYTCSAYNPAGFINKTVFLVVDSPPEILNPLQNFSIHAGESLQLTCNVSADPAAQILWTKDNSQLLPSHITLENNNFTLTIKSVGFNDDGKYTCLATNRQGNVSSSATVEVQASAEVKLNPSDTLKLLRFAKNITVDCMAYGKPTPSVKWMKGHEEIKLVNELNVSEVVQIKFNSTEFPWNVTSRLYLRVAGATYEDAGNYTCQVHNGVGHNSSLNATTEVLFRPEFDLYPESKIVVEGSNTTFLCNATGVPNPTVSWKFRNGPLPHEHRTSKDGLTLFFVENDATFEGNYTCSAYSQAGSINKTVFLVVDSPPKILRSLQNFSIHAGERLQLTCNVSADPAAQILWTKDNSQLLPKHVKLENNNFTLTIKSVGFNDDGKYTCLATNRQGNVSSSATVEVQASAEVKLNPSDTLKLLRFTKNITVDCMAYGKPTPSVKWMKGHEEVKLVNELNVSEVVQIMFNSTGSPWNVTSRLYLRVAGATYEDAGNYTCQVYNGVGYNSSLNATIEVLFRPEFDSFPESKIVVEGSNATFLCNATGVPNPTVSWKFGGGSFPQRHRASKDGLNLFLIKNDPSYEGNYTCSASNSAGVTAKTVDLTVDFPPRMLIPPGDVNIRVGERLALTCNTSADPTAHIEWTKDDLQLSSHVTFENNNSTLIIESTVIEDEGKYTCMAINRQGNASASATVVVQAPAEIKLDPSQTLKLLKHVKNITVDCMAYGKPTPSVKWMKGQEIKVVDELNISDVVQIVFNTTAHPWNVTSRLYLRVAGATYEEAGNYTCLVDNGVGHNYSLKATMEVLFRPEFDSLPENQIVLEENNATFLCNASGVPRPIISWKFRGGSLPQQHSISKDGLTLFLIQNDASYEGNYTCSASSRAGDVSKSVELTVDSLPKVLTELHDVTIHAGKRLELTCNTSADPAAQIAWTKDKSQLPPRATLENNNSTLIIERAVFDDEGRYTCVATNRQGNDSSTATVTVQASAEVKLNPSDTLELLRFAKNTTVDCMAYGKPTPSVKWMKGHEEIKLVSELNVNEVVQVVINSTAESPWNVTSRLYLRVAGATYEDAGNYTCQFHNGVGHNSSLNETIEVLFRPEFDSSPKSQIVLEGSNTTFPCNATGVPTPLVSWKYEHGSLPQQHSTSKNGLTLFLIQNDPSYEGNYTCSASNRAGVANKDAVLTVDSFPQILSHLQNVVIHVGKRLELTCNVSADPAAQILWTKDNAHLSSRATLENKNSTLIITSTAINDEGTYTCMAINRQGNASSSATVVVQASHHIFIPQPHTLKLKNYTRNITVDCHGYGKPLPTVVWKKDGKEIKNVSEFLEAYNNQVVQVLEYTKPSQWNVTSRLYLRAAGITYEESGNYTCEVFNGVGSNYSEEQSIEVLFLPQFIERPVDHIVIVGQNVTFPCKVSGVPEPSVKWNFSGGALPNHVIRKWDLTLFEVKNTDKFEGRYSCAASNRAGFNYTTAGLVVDVPPNAVVTANNVTLEATAQLSLHCEVHGDPAPFVYWTKNDSRSIPRAHYSNDNTTFTIPSVEIADEGLYKCVTINRAGKDSAAAQVTVQVPPKVFVSGSKTRIFKKGDKNVNITCYGNGYPAPTVLWTKRSEEIVLRVSEFSSNYTTRAVQVVSSDVTSPLDNVTSRLYLRTAGITYLESGNYSCTANNGVDDPARKGVEVLFEPEFDTKPRSQIVTQGSNVLFVCLASGVPRPRITWSFSGGALPPHTVENGNLSINSVMNDASCEGKYTCKAESKAGRISYTVSLTVHVPPSMIVKMKKSIVKERGDVVNLTCLASGDPLPFYTWTKNGLTIDGSAQLENDNRSLVLRNVTSADDGVYACWAVNEAGNVSTTTNLTIHATPMIVQGLPENTTAIRGDQVNFTCTGESIPEPEVDWKKGSDSLNHASITTSGRFRKTSELIIKEVAYEDRGEYTCVFSSYRGKASSASQLIVHVPVNITLPPSSARIPLGQETTLSCTAYGFPVPSVSWFYHGERMVETERIDIKDNVSEGKLMITSSLRFTEVTRQDSGAYTCKAKNLVGEAEETANLTILEKPDKLKMQFVQISSTTVWLSWTVPFDGNAIILYFSVRYNASSGQITRNVSSNKFDYNVTNLRPATVYKVQVTATNEQGTSVPASILATTREAEPGAPRAVRAWPLTSRSLYVNWTSPATTNGRLTEYNIFYGLSVGNFTPKGNLTVGPFRTWVNITGLRPHTNYSVQVQASTAAGRGNLSDIFGPVQTKEDAPRCPSNLTVTSFTATSITLRWRKPFLLNGILRAYFVYVTSATSSRIDNVTQSLSSENVTYNVTGLRPHTHYRLKVDAFTIRAGNCEEKVFVSKMTDESVPSPPRDVDADADKSDIGYLITWKSPKEPRGLIINYQVGFLCEEEEFSKIFNTETNKTRLSVELSQLYGDKTYSISVKGRTSKGLGEGSKTQHVDTPKMKPPQPTVEPSAWKNETEATTVVITIPEFSSDNGAIIFYLVIVVRVPKGFDPKEIPTPRDIGEDDVLSYEEAFESDKPAAYVAFQFKGTEYEKYRKFTVGNKGKSESSQRDRRAAPKEYYNGPLKPESEYRIFARAYTTETDYSNSPMAIVTTEPEAVLSTEKPTTKIPFMIIVIAVIVVLVAVIVAAVVVHIRRKRSDDGRVEERELQPLGQERRDEEVVYDNCAFEQRQPIPVEQLKDDYLYKHENDNQLFKEEFKLLPSPGDTPAFPTADIGALPENRVKNRYGNIKAYDHSRVILSSVAGVPESDYINANFIDGFNHPRKYIASQGPKPNTENDFWRMVWEQQSSVIVMLTRPVENGKDKCQKYWPSEGSRTYGKINVQLLDTEELMDYEIRTFSVHLPSEPQVKPRTVIHFFFTAWPDHDVPSYATGLLQFWKRVRAAHSPHSPMIVHCSAGVGRTGTFIVIDAMMSQIEEEQEVDIFSFVTRMRGQRNFMVQRESQYVLCHYALLEAITFGDTEIAVQDLRIKVIKLGQKDRESGTGFERQFELLAGVLPEENDDFETALRPENARKNRYSNFLPFDRTRVRLNDDDTVYINANYLEGYQQKRGYIATQAPLQETIEDFWNLVWKEGVACIVMLAQLTEKSETPIIRYWPEKDSVRYGSFMVTQRGETEKQTQFIKQKLTLTEVQSGNSREIYHFQYLDWAPGRVPHKPASVLGLIGAVQTMQQQTGNRPIIVHCSDGVGRTGAFCALSTSLERVKIEQSLDVFITARILRTQRPGMVRTLDQYKFIYDAVLAYLESFEEFQYENFKLKP